MGRQSPRQLNRGRRIAGRMVAVTARSATWLALAVGTSTFPASTPLMLAMWARAFDARLAARAAARGRSARALQGHVELEGRGDAAQLAESKALASQ